jgi:HEAT repeat protein
MEDPAESDKGCHAKMAIVEALTEFGYREHELFLRGIRHAQLEPAWGKPVDTAERLRGRCAEALTRAGYPDIMFELVTLLCDGEPRPRSDAVRILASFGNEPAELLLRLKAMNGDAEPEILGDTLGALMEMAPERSLDFVAAFVQSRDERVAQEAALALGGSRDAGALDRLVALWDKAIGSSVKKMLLLPMALIRSDAARDSLLRIVREEPAVYAAEALDALRIYGERPEGRGIIGAAVDERGEPAVHKVFSEQYPETDE